MKAAATAAALFLAAACEDPAGVEPDTSVTLAADTSYIAVARTVQLRALVGGAAAAGVTWRSLADSVATVDAGGVVSGRRIGAAGIVAESGGRTDTLRINVTPDPSRALATRNSHACVLDVEGRAHCWGAGSNGQLGNGGTASSPAPVAVSGNLVFDMVEASDSTTCGVTPGGDAYCWGQGRLLKLANGGANSPVPLRVALPEPVSGVSVGLDAVCALGRTGTAYCWGRNTLDTLGNGTPMAAEQLTPGPVSGNFRYSSLSAGSITTCAVASAGATYCWGINITGNLGVGHLETRPDEGSIPTRGAATRCSRVWRPVRRTASLRRIAS